MFRRIRWRLLATYLVVILPALSFLGLHLTQYFEGQSLLQVEASLLARARSIAAHVGDAVAAGDASGVQAEFHGTQFQGSPFVVIVDHKERVLTDDTNGLAIGGSASLSRERLARALAGHETFGTTRVAGTHVAYAAVPVRTAGAVAGAVLLTLPLVELTAQLQHTREFVAWTMVGTLVWSALVSLLLAHRIAAPIQEMRAVTARIAAGDLSQRAAVRTPDELGDLARSLNYMAGELERLDATRREFVADASHELRTPVANLAVAVEALRASLASADAGSDALLGAIEREVGRLRMLVEDLLDLSAVESGRVELQLGPTDVTQIVRGVLNSFKARAAQREVALDHRGPAHPVFAHADPNRLTQVLTNLLDNALKFTPRGGRVVAVIVQQRAVVTVSVDDTGPGIPPADLPHVFDRFFKADRSRSAHRSAGLGLAIVKRLVTAQGGEIAAENRAEGGARFTITLPA